MDNILEGWKRKTKHPAVGYYYVTDGRYTIKADWVCGADGVYRRKWHAMYNGREIGEVLAGTNLIDVMRETVWQMGGAAAC